MFIWTNQADEVVARQPSSRGMVGQFYSYPSSVSADINTVATYVRESKLPAVFVWVFDTIDFPTSNTTFTHRTQRDINGKRINTGLTDFFFARFTGVLDIQTPGTYRFFIASDDGFRLKINGQSIAEHTGPRGMAETMAEYDFPKAGLYSIELIYFERSGAQGLQLSWRFVPGVSKAVRKVSNYESALTLVD